MIFRKIEEKDLEALCNLYLQLVDFVDNQKVHEVYKEIKNIPEYSLFGVFDDRDELVATASLTRCFDLTEDCRYYYNMENFVVDKNCRRMGVGSFLIKSLEEYVVQNGGRYMNFTSSNWRHGAHAFYEKSGYDPKETKGFKKAFAKD